MNLKELFLNIPASCTIIPHTWPAQKIVGRNIAEILRQARALKHHRETGEIMPCRWEPGKPTLPEEGEAHRLFGKVWKTWKLKNAF